VHLHVCYFCQRSEDGLRQSSQLVPADNPESPIKNGEEEEKEEEEEEEKMRLASITA